MTASEKQLKKCKNGHSFYKSTDCPTCPICEAEKKPKAGFLSTLSAPARRALENNGITTVEELSKHSEKEILAFHGMGKASLPTLNEALKNAGLKFKK
jgi:DNA-directed RNA polymerase alpha subunit